MIIETHPIQYHAPVWQYLNQVLGIPVTVVYGSDFSVEGYRDKEFGISIAWDADLLEGYKAIFLSKSCEGGAKSDLEVNVMGLEDVIFQVNPIAILSHAFSNTAFESSSSVDMPSIGLKSLEFINPS